LKIFIIHDLTGINSDGQKTSKEENMSKLEFEPEAYLLFAWRTGRQRLSPKNEKPSGFIVLLKDVRKFGFLLLWNIFV